MSSSVPPRTGLPGERHQYLNYRSPLFNPNSVTIDDLKSILGHEGVRFTTLLRKAQLVDLFNEHVKNKAPPPPVEPSMRGVEDYTTAVRAPATPSRAKTLPVPAPAPSTPTPVHLQPTTAHSPDITTNDNVFQARSATGTPTTVRTASAPPAAALDASPTKTPSRFGRNKSIKLTELDSPQQVPTYKVLHPAQPPPPSPPKQRLQQQQQQPEHQYDSGPADEATVLFPPETEAATSAATPSTQPSTQSARPSPTKSAAAVLDFLPVVAPPSSAMPAVMSLIRRIIILVGLLAAMTFVTYSVLQVRHQSLAYCDTSELTPQGADMVDPAWYELPGCRPCPPNATCSDGEAQCIDKLMSLTAAGTCEYDAHKLDNLAKVARYLALQKGKRECGWVESGWVEEESLLHVMQQTFGDHFDKYSLGEFHELMMHNNKAKTLVSKLEDNKVFWESTEAEVPLQCRVLLAASRFFWNNLLSIVSTTVAISLTVYTYLRLRATGLRNRFVRENASNILRLLQRHAAANRAEPYMSTNQLRAHLQLTGQKNKEVWDRIGMIVREDSRVRETQHYIRGDPHVTWEWTAPATFDQ